MGVYRQPVVRHCLSDKNPDVRTGICSVCGPVKIVKKGRQWRCYTVWRVQRNRDLLVFRYGINWREWERLLIAQSGLCLICDDQMRSPHVDHCHETGVVRGLLCTDCNKGLGCFQDDPVRLSAAIDYLTSGGVR